MAEKALNPLLPGKLDMSPEEEQEQRWELMEANEASLLELQERKVKIDQRRQELDVDTKEQNLEAWDYLNRRIYGLVADLTNPETTEQVLSNITTGKDFNEAVKAVQGVAKLRDELRDGTLDHSAGSGKKKKIAVAFQSQGVSVMVGVETDEK